MTKFLALLATLLVGAASPASADHRQGHRSAEFVRPYANCIAYRYFDGFTTRELLVAYHLLRVGGWTQISEAPAARVFVSPGCLLVTRR